jgi:NitT/TauT family transport system substrate-binding protein
MITIKTMLRPSILFLALSFASTLNAHAQTKLKVVLDWKYQAQMGVFFLAEDRGYFKEEGLDVSFDQGEGAGAAAPKVASGAYDIGFGSIDSVVVLNSMRPTEAPVAIFQMYNRAPFVIAVRADSPIKTVKDLEGRTLGGPVNDGALKLFPALAKSAQIDASKVTITNMAPNLRAQMLMRGQVDGIFAFRTAMLMDTKLVGADPAKDIRFIDYADHGLDLYANAILASRNLVAQNPLALKGFLRALNRGIKDSLADPAASVASVLKREPLLNSGVERDRFNSMISNDMNAPEIGEIGLGDVVDSRLERTIGIVVQSNKLQRTPSASEIFDRRFLPPLAERVKHL